MKMKSFMTIAAVLALTSVSAHAAVNTTIKLAGLSDAGGEFLTAGSTVVVLVDANMNGFGDLTQATSSFKADDGDEIIFRGGTTNLVNGSEFQGAIDQAINGISGALAAKAVKVVWYDKLFDPVAQGPGAGVDFGMAEIGNLPNDTFSNDLTFFSQDIGGTEDPAQFVANMTTVPEPASLAFLLLGGAMIAKRPRKRA